MRKNDLKIGEILISLGLINEDQLEKALLEQKKSKDFLGLTLLRMGFLKEEGFLSALSEQFGIPIVHINPKGVDWNLVKAFSPTLLLDYRCFPVASDEWTVTFAITNPLDVWVIKKAEEETRGLRLKLALVCHGELDEVLSAYKERSKKQLGSLFDHP